jgi:hypothetical protein
MSTRREPPHGLAPLDGGAGPALPLTPGELRGLVHAAVARASLSRAKRSRKASVVLAFAAVLAATTAGASLYIARHRTSVADPPPAVAKAPAEPLPSSAPAPAPSELAPSGSVASDPPAPPRAAPRPPKDFLRDANQLRARERWQEASRAYEHVVASFPGTPEAYAATVAAGSLHLDHLGDARGAVGFFRAALRQRPNGPLAEEARWGVAEAERTLGDRKAEAAALRAFLARHPDALMAPRARARLEELTGGN